MSSWSHAARLAARSGAAAFVSIHLNASTTAPCPESRPIIARNAAVAAGAACQGWRIVAASFWRTRSSAAPAPRQALRTGVRGTAGFTWCSTPLVPPCWSNAVSSPTRVEARRLKQDGYKNRLAAAVADGIRRYLVATAFNPRRGYSAPAAGREVAAGDRKIRPHPAAPHRGFPAARPSWFRAGS